MENVRFVRLRGENAGLNEVFGALVFQYADEMNTHSPRPLPKPYQQKWADSMIACQGAEEEVLEVCFFRDAPAGFCYGRLEGENHPRPGWGYVLEFFILPEYRRRGLGSRMLCRLEKKLEALGAENLYLTADPVTGKPFWASMGYRATGEISPQTLMEIMEKTK